MKNSVRYISLFLLFLVISSNILYAQNYENFGFFGYLRSGFGLDSKGKSMTPFKAPNAEAKYRLGNEAETYLEATFVYFMKDKSGASFDTRVLFAVVTPMSKSNIYQTTFSLREAYVVGKGIWKAYPETRFWAGQRYYDRYDLHLNDFWYRDMSGFGGGIEDFEIGRFKAALAYLGGSIDQLSPSGSVYPKNQFVINKSSIDLKIYDIKTSFGNLGFTATSSFLSGDSVVTEKGKYTIADSWGWSLGIFYILPINKKEESRNIFNVFYGTGASENYRSVMIAPLGVTINPGDTYKPNEIKRLRIINDFLVNCNYNFSLQTSIVYQDLDNGLVSNNKLKWFSFGLRPIWHFNKYFSIAMELGYDYTNQEGGENGSLLKITLAPQITPNNTVMSRPALRLFVTYAFWSDSFVGQISPLSYDNQKDGLTFGIQAETWW